MFVMEYKNLICACISFTTIMFFKHAHICNTLFFLTKVRHHGHNLHVQACTHISFVTRTLYLQNAHWSLQLNDYVHIILLFIYLCIWTTIWQWSLHIQRPPSLVFGRPLQSCNGRAKEFLIYLYWKRRKFFANCADAARRDANGTSTCRDVPSSLTSCRLAIGTRWDVMSQCVHWLRSVASSSFDKVSALITRH